MRITPSSSPSQIGKIFYATLNGLAAALTSAGSNGHVVVADAQAVTTALTVPTGATLEVKQGGLLTFSGAGALTFAAGSTLMAGPYQIFAGTLSAVTLSAGACTAVYWEWWGALGNGATDDSAAAQAAVNAVRGVDGGIAKAPIALLGGKNYLIASTVNFLQQYGFRLEGCAPYSPTITWGGAAGGTALLIQGVASSRFAGFKVSANDNTAVAIDYDALSSGTLVSTKNVFDQVVIDGLWGTGIKIAKSHYQTDQTQYRGCAFSHCAVAAVNILDVNAVIHNFYDCLFSHNNIGITALNGTGGSFNCWGCGFSAQTTYDLIVFPSSRGTALSGCWAEASGCFVWIEGGSSSPGTATLDSCSVNSTNDSTNQIILKLTGPANLVITGGRYTSGQAGKPAQIDYYESTTSRPNVTIVGALFDGNPFSARAQSGTGLSAVLRNVQVTPNASIPSTQADVIDGSLARGSIATPLGMATNLIWSGAAWLKIPSGTVLAAGVNTFAGTSNNCRGATSIATSVRSWGGLTTQGQSLIAVDAGAAAFNVLVSVSAGFTLTSDLVFRVAFQPDAINV